MKSSRKFCTFFISHDDFYTMKSKWCSMGNKGNGAEDFGQENFAPEKFDLENFGKM